MAEEEIQNIRDTYSTKEFQNELVDEVVNVIVSKKKVWLDTIMRKEVGLVEDKSESESSCRKELQLLLLSINRLDIINYVCFYVFYEYCLFSENICTNSF
jgi:hypothetical protein